VDRRAQIPRPETEYLVELVIGRCAAAPKRILDLGTGSGAIALALVRAFPEAFGVGVDRSDEALALARENAEATGLAGRTQFLPSDWFSALDGERYDVIVANPPYLSAAETAQTSPEVRGYEPASALTGGGDGSGDLVTIIQSAPRFLRPGGLLALETGIGQHAMLLDRLVGAGFTRTESRQDLTGRDRYVFGVR
jgi:release factor glutamine methyltransferase